MYFWKRRLVKNDCRSSILTFKFILLHKLKFPLVKIKLNDIIIICSERIFLFYNYWEESTITFAEEERGSEQFIHLSGCILSSDNSKHSSFSKSPLKASTNLLSTVTLKERTLWIVEGRNLLQSKVSKRLSINLSHRPSLYNKKEKKITLHLHFILRFDFPFFSLTFIIKFSEKTIFLSPSILEQL